MATSAYLSQSMQRADNMCSSQSFLFQLLLPMIIALNACSIGSPHRPTDDLSIRPNVGRDSPILLNRMSDVLQYLAIANSLEPHERVVEFSNATNSYRKDPTISNQIRLALIFSLPGPLPGDDVANQKALRDLLTLEPPIPTALREIAESRLANYEQRTELQTENRRLKNQLKNLNAKAGKHLKEHERQITELSNALATAEAKIQALTSLEAAIKRKGQAEVTTP